MLSVYLGAVLAPFNGHSTGLVCLSRDLFALRVVLGDGFKTVIGKMYLFELGVRYPRLLFGLGDTVKCTRRAASLPLFVLSVCPLYTYAPIQ